MNLSLWPWEGGVGLDEMRHFLPYRPVCLHTAEGQTASKKLSLTIKCFLYL